VNEDLDPFERELRSFRPSNVTPRLEQRIRQALAGTPARAPSYRRRWLMASAGALAAAWLLLFFAGRGNDVQDESSRDVSDVPATTQAVGETPTLWAYEQAFSHSPATFDSLFDKRGLDAASAGTPIPPPRAFAWSVQEVSSWIGEF
jgi:hypothetical protein